MTSAAAHQPTPVERIPVTTPLGAGIGLRGGKGAAAFLGIPFAQAPAGALRLAPPQPLLAWEGVRDFSSWGAASLQPVDLMAATVPEAAPLFCPPELPQSEDCLYLNVWTPALDAQLPVLVWIHGGGWVTGTGAASWTDGEAFAMRNDVVVVSINYRLGLLAGLMPAAVDAPQADTANLGLLDQIAALRWVHDSIRSFGGDPERVTVAGESAGAFSAIALMAAPAAAGLFHRVIAQSGHAHLLRSAESAAEYDAVALAQLGVAPGPRALDALRALPAQAFLDAGTAIGLRAIPPVVDGVVLPRPPLDAIRAGDCQGFALLLGSNHDEFASFRQLPLGDRDQRIERADVEAAIAQAPRPGLSHYLDDVPDAELLAVFDELGTDRDWRAPIRQLARACADGGVTCLVYEFDWPTVTLGGRMGAAHQAEIPFVFDTLDAPGVAAIVGDVASEPDAVAQVRNMSGAWGAFVSDGSAQLGAAGRWQPFTRGHESIALFENGSVRQLEGYRAERLDVWDAEQLS